MSGGGTKKPKLPPLPDPVPTLEDIDIQAAQKGEAERKKVRSKFGRAGTILSETTNLGTTTRGKSPILGVVGGT